MRKRKKLESKKLNKANTFVLFIDDQVFPVVETLKEAGYHTKRVKDIINIDDLDIQVAHVIFVDYTGVGKKLSERGQGAGVIKAIKNNYGDKKRVILYSGFGIPIDRELDNIVDNKLPKNSDVYEFQQIIDEEIQKLNDILQDS